MLFSDKQIADYVNANFEASWESVRPVPVVTVDFGNGKVLKRTVRGNVASYVCTTDGVVFDVLPGIYESQTFLTQLKLLCDRVVALPAIARNEAIAQYHATALANMPQDSAPYSPVADITPFHAPAVDAIPPRSDASAGDLPFDSMKLKAGEVRALAEDTQVNEGERRRMIHEKLTAVTPAKPADISKWLYREVLHADIDDPYLGMSEYLFDDYPFEDK